MRFWILILFCSFHVWGMGDELFEVAADPAQDPIVLGQAMKDGEVQALEGKIRENPEDLESRILALGYYFYERFFTAESNQKYRQHALWVIEKAPDTAAAGTPLVSFDPSIDGHAYNQARDLWVKHVTDRPGNLKILHNAAMFFMPFAPDQAEGYLRQASALDPENPLWEVRLGQLQQLRDGLAAE